MKDYPFNFNQLNEFSQSLPYVEQWDEPQKIIWQQLNAKKSEYNFPAISNDIGHFINFLFNWYHPEYVFEFGSGYGHSCFWYLLNNDSIKEITLTEKRDDLLDVFNSLNWPKSWKAKMNYFQQDSFEVFKDINQVDFILIDGVKADYLKFLKLCEQKISSNGLVLIDNSYWRGSFLDEKICQTKNTARQIKALHQYIKDSSFWQSVFIPYQDGISLLRPKSS